jgi:hypothetical protein
MSQREKSGNPGRNGVIRAIKVTPDQPTAPLTLSKTLGPGLWQHRGTLAFVSFPVIKSSRACYSCTVHRSTWRCKSFTVALQFRQPAA